MAVSDTRDRFAEHLLKLSDMLLNPKEPDANRRVAAELKRLATG